MDRNVRDFIGVCVRLFIFLLCILAVIGLLQIYSSLSTYNFIIYAFAVIVSGITLYFVFAFSAVLYVYKKNRVSRSTARFVKWILNFLFPLVVYFTGFFHKNKDEVRGLLIKVNNILVESSIGKYDPNEILVLLPHCLQNSTCIYKVTSDINNCRKCGKCCIGDICELAKRKGVDVKVVTGGTAARSLIIKNKPRVILSVACERDLSSGINDVRSIPVLGLVNDRKYGPCYNTSVDIARLEEKLDRILKV